jgi:hypothetical protein
MPCDRLHPLANRPATRKCLSAILLFSAAAFASTALAAAAHRPVHPAGLGKVLTTKDGGQIFGFDINQNGDDGILASEDLNQQEPPSSVETFDQNTGKITKSFAKHIGEQNSYVMHEIFAGDVGLLEHDIIPKGQIFGKRKYVTMNPVTGQKFTGDWTPPIKVIVETAAENQATSTGVVFAIEPRKEQDKPVLLVSDIAANTFSNVIKLDPFLFSFCNAPRPLLGQYIAANEAVLASSPDCGKRGGAAPINALVDLSTGKTTVFDGYNNGSLSHAGLVNGLAVDPNTGVAATTTELNAQVEFYDMNKKTGITFVQLPCTNDQDQLNSGTTITNDPVNKLFLVTDIFYACTGSQEAAIVVYDESGNLVESITGFNPDIRFAVDQPPPRINPSKRMGWAFGGPNGAGDNGVSQLQQFFY